MRSRFGEFEFDASECELTRRGRRIALEPRVLELLAYLLERPNRLVTKDELLSEVWGGLAVSETSVTRCVSVLRAALGDTRDRARFIETVHGRGYRFRVHPEGDASRVGGSVSVLSSPDVFVGRDDVLARLEIGLEAARMGRGRLVLLSGEAGIGKTHTMEHLGRSASNAGGSVRIGRSREEKGAPALWPWTQVFRQELEEFGREGVLELAGQDLGTMVRLVPELAASPGARNPGAADDGEGVASTSSTWGGAS